MIDTDIERLLRKTVSARYVGRVPQEVAELPADQAPDRDGPIMRRLGRVPEILRAHLRAELIVTVWKSDCFPRGQNYYVIRTVDGGLFMVS